MGKVERKWGWYAVIGSGKGWKTKILCVRPKKQTSFQRHFHRDELWVFLESYEFKIVKKREWHQLTNHSSKDMYLIEIQVGKCYERDIERR